MLREVNFKQMGKGQGRAEGNLFSVQANKTSVCFLVPFFAMERRGEKNAY
jgi:hypothetical protein